MKINWKSVSFFLSGLFFFSGSTHAKDIPSRKMDVRVVKIRRALKKKIEAGQTNDIINYVTMQHDISKADGKPKVQWDNWDSWDAWNNWDTWDTWDSWNNWDTWNTWDSWNSWSDMSIIG